ncbi:MAG: tetratricopeptide repeat protein [Candidatus Promineifilaceae bacterium]
MFDLSTLSPRERRLLRSAQDIAQQGKKQAAEALYRSYLGEFPDSIPGLLGLAQTSRSADEQAQLLNRVLELDPQNTIALAALDGASLDKLLTPEAPEPVATPDTSTVEKAPPAPKAIVRTEQEPTHAYSEDVVGGLRCNKCGKPIDQHNSKYTAVGYRCNTCLRELEDQLYSASISTYIIAFLIGLTFSAIMGTAIVFVLGSGTFFAYLITFFISSALGGTIGSLAFRAGGRNRGRYLSVVMSLSIWLGALLALAIAIVFANSAPFIILSVFAFGASSTAYFRVR